MDETLQVVNHKNALLKSVLHDLQQEKDSLKHDVVVLTKQLQNVSDKVRYFHFHNMKKNEDSCGLFCS